MKRYFCNGKKGYCDRGNDNKIDCTACEFANGTGGELIDCPNTNIEWETPEDCGKCPYKYTKGCVTEQRKNALDLINRQQAEIERLLQKLQQPQTEAIKEFAEKLKDLSCGSDLYDRDERWVQAVTVEEIDETYKEMVGDSK